MYWEVLILVLDANFVQFLFLWLFDEPMSESVLFLLHVT